ncbi:hypothetical protein CEY04_20295 [Achromobacter sp. HZ28]|nr:hypothetical protein CEY04_20295 [Achromobacter sp. HZ28]OWT76521.1 hypothetical protein CEY05_15750 [Achromobacter sp. HZ34]
MRCSSLIRPRGWRTRRASCRPPRDAKVEWDAKRKAIRPLWPSRSAASHVTRAGRDHDRGHSHDHEHSQSHSHSHDHDPGQGQGHAHHAHGIDCDCGHAHVPPPQAVAGPLDLRKAWSAILAVGPRPCSIFKACVARHALHMRMVRVA